VKAKRLWETSKSEVELRDEGDQYIMAQSVVEWTGDQIEEAARQASRAATALAASLEESLGATRRIAKLGGDTAEELIDDTIKRLQRHPVETVTATFSIGIATGFTIAVATGIFIPRTIWFRNMTRRHFSAPGMRPLQGAPQ
jgi:hypothetical protein